MTIPWGDIGWIGDDDVGAVTKRGKESRTGSARMKEVTFALDVDSDSDGDDDGD